MAAANLRCEVRLSGTEPLHVTAGARPDSFASPGVAYFALLALFTSH
jgi:hypothetical protein